jgi:sulfoquinovosidase
LRINNVAFAFTATDDGFELRADATVLLRHSAANPAVGLGVGTANVDMCRGNFDIQDVLAERWPLDCCSVDGIAVRLWSSQRSDAVLQIAVQVDGDQASLVLSAESEAANRIWVHFPRGESESIWGGGEQMSYLRLNGRRFPFWTSEPGVGRDKTTALTKIMDESGNAGGDYWTTNYPQPTWLSSAHYAVHSNTAHWSALDLSCDGVSTYECWNGNLTLEFFAEGSLPRLVGALSDRFGKAAPLPDWVIGGAIVGLKEGEASFDRLEKYAGAGAAISGLWCEDWIGIRQTSFGRRLFWDWQWNAARYPDLPARIAALAERKIRFLGYVNPYIANDAAMFAEGASAGYFALRLDSDDVALVDFGEFYCGVVDFTNPAACEWFADRVIGREMLDFGLSGWMADFGEYLPTDIRLFDGSDPMEAHNRWPVLWAKVNADAIAKRGKAGEAVFFMRAGFSGVQAHCPLLWAGDQCVDFTRHDGIGTVLTAALSSGLVGNLVSHHDVGGYTSLHGNVRTEELLRRWIDLGAFTPVMRGHEGNRPDDNLQIDQSPELLAHFARMSQIHDRLAPYVRHVLDEGQATGLPAQRPLFLHYNAPEYHAVQDQYLYGADLLVAPVIEANVTGRDVIIPSEGWANLWNGEPLNKGQTWFDAPHGKPPVAYRLDSRFASLFVELREEFG